jgi:SAM-dependent methyltransferase
MKFLKRTDLVDLPVAMSGAKLADRLLVIGCGDPGLIAKLALKVGLTGRACAVDDSPARMANAARIAEREGALVESAEAPGLNVPFESEAFDLVVVRNTAPSQSERRARCAAEALRLLRPGGRCLIVEGSSRSGIAGLLQRDSSASGSTSEEAGRSLTAAGFAAVRTLAERGGMTFVEGVKRNL